MSVYPSEDEAHRGLTAPVPATSVSERTPGLPRRAAVIAEWVDEHGGAERVLAEMLRLLPGATLETTAAHPHALPGVARERIHQHTPALRDGKRRLAGANAWLWLVNKPLPNDADAVISSHHLASHWIALRAPAHIPHLSYVHTPARYAWFPSVDDRARTPGLGPAVGAAIRRLDRAAARRVTAYAANSETTRRRVQTAWGRDATVIHPPVAPLPAPRPRRADSKQYLLAVGRFVGYKRLDFAVAVAEAARTPLKIAGSGPLEADLRRLAGRASVPVELIISPSDGQLATLYAQARALVYPAVEDFGIVPVEAMAAGTPVLALREGGTAETVTHGDAGFLHDELDVDRWCESVRWLDSIAPSQCRLRAAEFAPEAFRSRFERWVQDALAVGQEPAWL